MSDELEDEGMTFWEHLQELRSRLVKMAIAAVVGASTAWFFKQELLNLLLYPFVEAWQEIFPEPPELHFPDPAGLFVAYLKLSIIAGVVFALPMIFYQVWAFVAPGLYAKEKRFAIPFVGASTALFCGGAYYGMTLAFPLAFQFLLGMAGPEIGATTAQGTPSAPVVQSSTAAPNPGLATTDSPAGSAPVPSAPTAGSTPTPPAMPKVNIKPTIMVNEYVKFVSRMLIAFGVVFELPVLVFFLAVAGVINHRHLIKFFRYFIVIAFVTGAIITPPDLLSQFLLALPLCVLYVISIGLAYIFGKKETSLKLPSEDAA